jgi:hypothetical protein
LSPNFSGFFHFLSTSAFWCDCLQLRFLVRARCAFYCALKVAFPHLEVMFGGDALRIADPGTDDVNLVSFHKLRFPAGT